MVFHFSFVFCLYKKEFFNLLRLLLMITFYYHIKILIDF